jgi:PDZ domain-containing secreted protein
MILILTMNNLEIKKDIDELEKKIDKLIHEYEKFFLGINNVEPIQLRNQVNQLIRKYSTTQINNVMINFKFKNLVARFLTYQEYWNRNLRLIEEGKDPKKIKRLEVEKKLFKVETKEKPNVEFNQNSDIYQSYLKISTKKSLKPLSREEFFNKIKKIQDSLKEKYGDEVKVEIKLEETEKGIKFKTIVRKKI